MSYRTLQVRVQGPICFIQFHRPEANNTIDALLTMEMQQALDACGDTISIVVLEGSPEIFCLGADFKSMQQQSLNGASTAPDPEPLYDVWKRLATGPFISIAHVRGKVNAGGVGFVAACDIVLANDTAQFSLSELLFGLFPACVMPFLIRRTGFQRAHYLTLTTQPIDVHDAQAWGLVDRVDAKSDVLLRKHLMRMKLLSKEAITRYKHYMNTFDPSLEAFKSRALESNRALFSDPANLSGIYRFAETGLFPWDKGD